MGVYEDLGLTPIINAAGSNTRLGGALMLPEVVEAMRGAAQVSVSMEELQAAASRIIARATGADAGYVTSGAAAALTLGTAACMTGLDLKRIDRLPETTGMPDEVIIARDQRNGYDHAIRAAGARLIEVGMNEVVSGAGVRPVEAWEYEVAITERTAAIAYFARPGARPSVDSVINLARSHRVPVIVDAAAQLPPVENLRAYIAKGADLVCFSGGKALRGPQNTGILCGRRDLITAAAVQQLDLDARWDCWEPPDTLLPKKDLPGLPRHGIGRGFKVSKESIVGLLTALQLFSPERVSEDIARCRQLLHRLAERLAGIEGSELTTTIPPAVDSYPRIQLKIGRSAAAAAKRLQYEGSPPVYVDLTDLDDGILTVNAMNLTMGHLDTIARRLREAMTFS